MEIIIITFLSIVGSAVIANVAASGCYACRSKEDPEKKKSAAKVSAPSRRSARAENKSFVVYQDESLARIPETRRQIRSPDDVYLALRDEDEDDYLLNNLDMDFSPTSVIPPDAIERNGCLEFTLRYHHLSSTLTLTLIRLGDLPLRADTGKPPDPLVEFDVKYAHDGKIKSETYQTTCNPRMFESFRFKVPVNDLRNQMLIFKVTDMMQTNIPEPPPPPKPEDNKKKKGNKKKKENEPPSPPPPPPSTLIGFVMVPLVRVAMKELLSDTEITILRDVINLKPRSSSPEKFESTGSETMESTTRTGTHDFEDTLETVQDDEKKKVEETEKDEEVAVDGQPYSSQVEKQAVQPVSSARPSVTFSREVDSNIPGPALLVSLAYLKTSEKLTVIVMKAKNLKPVSKNKQPDPLVKVYIKMGEKKLRKRSRSLSSTVVRKHNVAPVWNESFNFAIPHRILHKVAVLLQVNHFSEKGKKRVIGEVVIGSKSNDEAMDHWNAMLTTESSVAKWHQLEEEQQGRKRSNTPTKKKTS